MRIAGVCIALGLGAQAQAAPEAKQWQIGGEALVLTSGTPAPGLALEAQWGWTDSVAQLTRVGARFPADSDTRKIHFTGAVGARAAWDVVRVAPFFDFSLSGSLSSSGGAAGLAAGVGTEYWIARRWALGLRIEGFWTPLSWGSHTALFSGTLGLGLAHTF